MEFDFRDVFQNAVVKRHPVELSEGRERLVSQIVEKAPEVIEIVPAPVELHDSLPGTLNEIGDLRRRQGTLHRPPQAVNERELGDILPFIDKIDRVFPVTCFIRGVAGAEYRIRLLER